MNLQRLATIEDISGLCNLLKILFEQEEEFCFEQDKQENALKTLLSSPELGHILIIEISAKIVGMVTILYTFSTALNEKVGILEDMIISPDHQNQGLGSVLIDYALVFAKSQGLKRITLLTDSTNIKAHRFYEKNNFSCSKMVPFRKIL
ncbi:MAG: GNAT family N-acetyltransferase [Sulfurovaceae bacterium]|nr:GNAT family N-acetyltransferase [Sulfurovaceae bacterium]